MHVLFALFLIPFGAIHFLPTIIAALRGGRSVVGIFLLNLFLGWTVIGWIIALIWALRDEPKYVYVYPQGSVRRYLESRTQRLNCFPWLRRNHSYRHISPQQPSNRSKMSLEGFCDGIERSAV